MAIKRSGSLMAYEFEGWTLFKKHITLRSGHERDIYFFSKREPKSGEPCEMPAGYEVVVNKTTGLPCLRRVR